MAMGYTDDDTPNVLQAEFLNAALVEQRASRLVVNNNADIFCLNDACGEEIPLPRRQAIPGARFCISCQSRADQRMVEVRRS